MTIDPWSSWTHNQCGLYKSEWSMRSLQRCYLLASHVKWQLPRGLSSVSNVSWESSSRRPRPPLIYIPLVISQSKESLELRLDAWPGLKLLRARVSAQLLIIELKSLLPHINNHNSFQALTTSIHPLWNRFILCLFSKTGSLSSQPLSWKGDIPSL